MKTLAGSKRTAGTPFASPTKAAASAKRSRTQYDYYDEDDSEALPEDRWSPETDSGSEMSLDGDDKRDDLSAGFVAASPSTRGPRSHQDPRNTDVRLTIRFTIPDRHVQTADILKEPLLPAFSVGKSYARGSSNTKTKGCIDCACSKYGRQCSASKCGCKAGTSCKNPLKNLDLVALFGENPTDLHPCFITWVARQTKAKLERTNAQSLFDLVFETPLMLEEYHRNMSEPYLEWRAKWDRLCASERDGEAGLALKQELLRWGLTSRSLQSVYYSFCRREGWVETDHEWHCPIDGACMQWREWHCPNCNQCSYGLSLPCGNCGRGAYGSEDSEFNELSEDDWWIPLG